MMSGTRRRGLRRSATLLVALLALPIAGCAYPSRLVKAPTATSASANASETVPYALYTHCGIDEARFDNRFYEAIDPLSDGNGNPPDGWGNPIQEGTMRRLSSNELVFQDQRGHYVVFRLRPGASAFRRICR